MAWAAMQAELSALRAEMTALKAENEALKAHIVGLTHENELLKRRLSATRPSVPTPTSCNWRSEIS